MTLISLKRKSASPGTVAKMPLSLRRTSSGTSRTLLSSASKKSSTGVAGKNALGNSHARRKRSAKKKRPSRQHSSTGSSTVTKTRARSSPSPKPIARVVTVSAMRVTALPRLKARVGQPRLVRRYVRARSSSHCATFPTPRTCHCRTIGTRMRTSSRCAQKDTTIRRARPCGGIATELCAAVATSWKRPGSERSVAQLLAWTWHPWLA